MANNTGTLVIAAIRPWSDADTFPSAYANEIKGGLHAVATDASRNAIPSDRLEDGMLVVVYNSAEAGGSRATYQRNGSAWDRFGTSDASLADIYSYIDGSLALRDLEISQLDASIIRIDVSLNDVVDLTTVLNASLAGYATNASINLAGFVKSFGYLQPGPDPEQYAYINNMDGSIRIQSYFYTSGPPTIQFAGMQISADFNGAGQVLTLFNENEDLLTIDRTGIHIVGYVKDASLNAKLNNTTDTFTGLLTVNGSLYIIGDIIQNGSTYITHVENLNVSSNLITLREGAVTQLPDGSVSGFYITKPDGVNNLFIGTDNDGILRIGWEGDSFQAVATREDAPTNGWYAYWDDSSSMFKTRDLIGTIDSSYVLKTNLETSLGLYVKKAGDTMSGLLIANASISTQEIYASKGNAKHLKISGGNADPSSAAGHLTLKAGDVSFGDIYGTSANVYIVPGSGSSSGNNGRLYLGNSAYSGNTITMEAQGTETDIHVSLYQKGTGFLQLGTSNGFPIIQGSQMALRAPLISVGTYYATSGTAQMTVAQSGGNKGSDLYINAGRGTIDASGGDLILYGGDPVSTGIRGNVRIPYLPAQSSETKLIYYEEGTGKISYGDPSTGSSGVSQSYVDGSIAALNASVNTALLNVVEKTGTPANQQIAVWTNDGSITGYTDLTWNGDRIYMPRSSNNIVGVHAYNTNTGTSAGVGFSAQAGNIISMYSFGINHDSSYFGQPTANSGFLLGGTGLDKIVIGTLKNNGPTMIGSNNQILFKVQGNNVYLPLLPEASTAKMLYFNPDTSTISYGNPPAGATGSYVLKSGDTMSGQLTVDASITAYDISVGTLTVMNYQYFGDRNNDGSWRFGVDSSGNMAFEKRESGIWVYKSSMI